MFPSEGNIRAKLGVGTRFIQRITVAHNDENMEYKYAGFNRISQYKLNFL